MLDLLTLTAIDASRLLQCGATTSVALVETYLQQIATHNHAGLHLNAIINTAPREKLLSAARTLDSERQSGLVRSPLHGIPIVVKDLFLAPDLGLPTTAGSPYFESAKAKRTAPLIQHLINSGLIILGTTNLTEWCGLKYPGMTPGWSPIGGQTQSPYIFGGLEAGEKMLGNSSAGGSSSGSAVAVAAGMATLSIGTECCGSLITPANRAGLYALKCGLGTVDVEGMFRYTDCIDFVGGMAKGVADLGMLTAMMMQRERQFEVGGGFGGLRVGFCDVNEWRLPEEVCSWPRDTWKVVVCTSPPTDLGKYVLMGGQETAYSGAMSRMREHGAIIDDKVDLQPPWELFKVDGKSLIYRIAMYHIKNNSLPAFLDELDSSPVHSIQDIITYNEDHPETCLPPDHESQSELHDLLANTSSETECQAMLAELQARGEAGLGKLLETMDVVVALTESPLCMFTTAIGGPIACMPLGVVKYSEENQRPFGICAAAKRGGEELLLRFMSAFEAVFPARPLPRPLLAACSSS